MKLTKEIIMKAKAMYDIVSGVKNKDLPRRSSLEAYHKEILTEAEKHFNLIGGENKEEAQIAGFCLLSSILLIVEGDENQEKWYDLAKKVDIAEDDFSALMPIFEHNINAEAIKEIKDGKIHFEDGAVIDPSDVYQYDSKYADYKYKGEIHINLMELEEINKKIDVDFDEKEPKYVIDIWGEKEIKLNEQFDDNFSNNDDPIENNNEESKDGIEIEGKDQDDDELSNEDDQSEIGDDEKNEKSLDENDNSKIDKLEEQEDKKIEANANEKDNSSNIEISTEKKEEPSKDEIKINDTNQTKEDLSNEESTSELTEGQFDNVMEIYNDYKRGDSTMWEILDEKLDDLKQDKKQYKEYAYKNIETYRFVSMYLAFDKARSERSFLSYFNPYNWYKYPKENRQINIIKEKLAENGVTDESLADYKKQFENMFNESKSNNRSMDEDENSVDNSQDGIETDEKIPGLDKEFKEVNRNSSTKQVDNPTKEIDISKNN